MSKKAREMSEQEMIFKLAWKEKSLVDRENHMPKVIVKHPQFVHSLCEISRRSNRVKTQNKGAALLIVCATGGGKSTIAEFVKSSYPDEILSDRTLRHCVTFTVPPRPSSTSMSSSLLNALGDPMWSKGRTDVLASRAIHLLKECQTDIIIMDNAHDIPERRSAKGVREVGNWLRDIIDNVPALFVSLGAEQGLDVFKANSQSRRRCPAAIRIDYFDCNTSEGVSRLRRFLHEVDIQLPLAELSNLGEFEITKRIWIATNGVPDYIIKLLTESLEFVLKAKKEKIELSDLSLAYKRLYENMCSTIDPFKCSTEELRLLNKEGEPFEDWLNDGYQ